MTSGGSLPEECPEPLVSQAQEWCDGVWGLCVGFLSMEEEIFCAEATSVDREYALLLSMAPMHCGDPFVCREFLAVINISCCFCLSVFLWSRDVPAATAATALST